MSETVISRNGSRVVISPKRPMVIIGERINPTGKVWLQQAIADGDFAKVGVLAKEQVAAGAHIIDVNVMVPGVDEVDALPRAVEAVQNAVDVPLCLDSSRVDALKAGLAACEGKVIVNSVSGDPEKLDRILPLVQQHHAVVVGLAMDKQTSIPRATEERVDVAARILEAVQAAGIPRSDLIMDCLTLAVSVDQDMGRVALESIRRVSTDLDLNVIMGISNVSFGLPRRAVFNVSFIAMAMANGMTCAIVNPHSKKVREAILAADVLLGHDNRAADYLSYYRSQYHGAANGCQPANGRAGTGWVLDGRRSE